MTVRYVWSAVVTGLFAAGMITVGVQRGLAQGPGPNALPGDGAKDVTVVGCVKQGLEHYLVLLNPTTEPIASVPDGNCNLPIAEPLLELHDTKGADFDKNLLGQWVAFTGRLEHAREHDQLSNPREFHVRSYHVVPVVPPRAAEIITPPPPAPPRDMPLTPEPATAPPPTIPESPVVGTTGSEPTKLPKTASDLPLGLLSTVMLLMGALAVRLIRLRMEGRV